jgi:hypothetical protein
MLVRRPRQKFAFTFKTHEGNKFRGEFGDPNSAPRPRREVQNLPHRMLVTSRKAIAKAGDLVEHKGVKFVLCGQHTLEFMQRFLAVEVNHIVSWTSSEEIEDPVTRVMKDVSPVVRDPALPVAFEPRGGTDEEGFERTKFRAFTHADVKEGDRLDGLKVLRAYDVLGLRAVEMA